jgi:L-lactate dehydrogenase complex protein LldE
MRVALGVPCYVDQLRPSVARASLTLLERLGCDVTLAHDAPCCGQPMTNAGFARDAIAAATCWAEASAEHDVIVLPSGSCTHHIRHHLPALVPGASGLHAARATFELCEFLVTKLGLARVGGRFPHRVAIHLGCHALRGLRLGGASERLEPPGGPMRQLLSGLDGIDIVPLDRVDECCGFGGSFCVAEPDVSVAMGRSRLRDMTAHGATVLVSSDPSCMLHLEGLARREHPGLRVMHIAELLEEATQ